MEFVPRHIIKKKQEVISSTHTHIFKRRKYLKIKYVTFRWLQKLYLLLAANVVLLHSTGRYK